MKVERIGKKERTVHRVCNVSHLFRFLHCFLRLRQARMVMVRKTEAASADRMMTMTDME